MFENFTEANWIAFGTAVVALVYNVFNTLYARRLNKNSVRRARFNEDVKKKINDLSEKWAAYSDWLEAEALGLERGDVKLTDNKKMLDDFSKIRRDGSRIINDIYVLEFFRFEKFHRCDEDFMDYFYEKYQLFSASKSVEEHVAILKLLSRETDNFRNLLKSTSSYYEARL